jgi:hypothetical protein
MRLKNGAWMRRAQRFALLLFTCFATTSLLGQGGKASIGGVAADASGAVIQAVTITARNVETGFTITVASNESGTYSIPLIAVGSYTVTAQKDGFKTAVQNILLTADKIATVDFKLEIGAVGEKVTVEANSQLLETETAQLGQVIQEKEITELPLNGRNPAALVLLTPGTVDVLSVPGAGAHQSYTTFPTETGASANGGRQGSTYYLLDGSYNMDTIICWLPRSRTPTRPRNSALSATTLILVMVSLPVPWSVSLPSPARINGMAMRSSFCAIRC